MDFALLGERLSSFAKEKGYNSSRFAKKVNVSVSFMSEVMNGKKLPGGEFLISIKRNFPDLDLEWLFTGVSKTSHTRDSSNNFIPLMAWCDSGCSGQGIPLITQEYIAVSGISESATFALTVASDSMVNLIYPGDTLLCREVSIELIQPGSTYVFITKNGTEIRQIFHERAKLRLCAFNRSYADTYYELHHILKCFEILQVIHQFREIETFELSSHFNEINVKLDALSLKLDSAS